MSSTARSKTQRRNLGSANQESIAKQYYFKCAELAGEGVDEFMWRFFDQLNFYNHRISTYASEIVNLQSRDDRLVRLGVIVGKLFAELCGCPDEEKHKLIGAGAFIAVSLSTQQFFSKSRIAT